MSVAVKRVRFAGTFFTPQEYALVVNAARLADVSLAGFLRRSALREAEGLAGQVTVVLGREQAAAAVGALEQVGVA
jgi:uncharacterized protein (DUF1778 family)